MPTTRSLSANSAEPKTKSIAAVRPARRRSERGRRVLRYVVILALLAAGVAGGSYALNNLPESKDAAAPPANSEPLKEVMQSGYVDVPRGTTDLKPKVAGQVTRLAVEENVPVKKGDVLFELDAKEANLKLQSAKLALKDAQLRLAQAKDVSTSMATKMEPQQAKIDAFEKELEGLRKQLSKVSDLVAKKIAKAIDEEILQSAIDAQVKRIEAEKLLIKDLEELQRRQEVNRDHVIRIAENGVEQLKEQVRQAEHLVALHVVHAPYDGFVLRRLINVGDVTSPESPMPALIFCSNDTVIVRAEIDQEWAHLVSEGMRATIRDDARNDLEWTGTVKSLANWFEKPRPIFPQPREMNDVRTMECIIVFDKAPNPPLRINQRVQVSIRR